jgi:Heavy-metal resistance
MNHHSYYYPVILLAAALGAGCTSGQHYHPPDSSASTPYAGQQNRPIKALSAQDEQDLRMGKGLGLAKAAELNGYPGPMHTLELAQALQLSEEQRAKTLTLLNRHKTEVKALGEALIAEERTLDLLFAQKTITSERVSFLTTRIGQLQAQIRAEHLRTHLEQTAMLSDAQIVKYNTLRGYAN